MRLMIIGGGTAGWMAAACLRRFLPRDWSVRLVESDEIGTVGVGEATIPQIRLFNDALGIDEDEFLAATQGTIKLGIEFRDWTRVGHRYMHAFGAIGRGLGLVDFHHYWLRARAAGLAESLDHYSLNERAARARRMQRGAPRTSRYLLEMPYAYHFDAALYAGHPYGHDSTPESLAAIQREDLADFHRRHYGANRASVAIVGDLDRATAERIAIRLTEALPATEPAVAPPVPATTAEQVFRIPHPSAQAHILVGQPGMARQDPDYFPLLVGNHVLGGGGFVSRLTREVREKRGFAYSVYSFLSPQQVAGPFQIGLQTRGGQAEEALAVVRATLAAFLAEGPGAEELQAAKDNIVNGFGLRLDSNAKLLDYVAMIGFYRLPLDWLETYPRQVEAVTVEAVRDAWQRRIRPERLVTVIAGGDGDRGEPAPANGAPAAGNAGAGETSTR